MDLAYLLIVAVFLAITLALDRGLRRVGAQEMSWAYVLSGVITLGLVVYLVVALVRAEDL